MAKKVNKGSSRQSMRDKMRERATTREQSGRGGVKFNFPEGREVKFLKIDKACTKKLDFIPYEITVDNHPSGVAKGDLWYQRTIYTHNKIGPEEKSYLCLKSIGKKCPICDYAAQLQRDPKADDELIKSLKAKERELFQVVDLSSDSDDILLWEYSYHLFGKLLEEEIRNSEPEEDFKAGFADLEGGSTLKIRFEKKTMGKNEFYEVKRIDFVERDDYPESVLDDVLNLDEILNVLPYEKLEGIFLDTDPEPDEKPARGKKKDDEKEEKSSRRSKKEEDEEPPRRGRGKDKEEEAPKSKRGSKKEEPEEPEEVDIDDLDLDELKAYIEEHELDIKVKRAMDEDDVRELIREAQAEAEEPPKRSSRGSKDKKEEEAPKRGAKKDDKSVKRGSKKEEPEDDECIGGGTFGEDEGEYDQCMDCDRWDECKELSSEKKKSAKKGRR